MFDAGPTEVAGDLERLAVGPREHRGRLTVSRYQAGVSRRRADAQEAGHDLVELLAGQGVRFGARQAAAQLHDLARFWPACAVVRRKKSAMGPQLVLESTQELLVGGTRRGVLQLPVVDALHRVAQRRETAFRPDNLQQGAGQLRAVADEILHLVEDDVAQHCQPLRGLPPEDFARSTDTRVETPELGQVESSVKQSLRGEGIERRHADGPSCRRLDSASHSGHSGA